MSLSSYVLLIIFIDNKYTWMVEIERLGLPQLITNYFTFVLLIPIFHSLDWKQALSL